MTALVRAFLWLSAAILSAVGLSLLLNQIAALQHKLWPWCTAFLTLLFLALNFIYGRKKKGAEFASALIGGFVARFLAALLFLLIFFIIDREQFFRLAIHFLAQWLLFTLAEIAYLSTTVKNDPHT